MLDRVFDFDGEILDTKVYQGQMRSLIRRALRRGKKKPKQEDGSSLTTIPRASFPRGNYDEWVLTGVHPPKEMKLLLLGPCNTANSSLLSWMKLSQSGYGQEERERCKLAISKRLYQGMQFILNVMGASGLAFWNQESEVHASNIRFSVVPHRTATAAQIFEEVVTLWKDPAVQDCYGDIMALDGDAMGFLG